MCCAIRNLTLNLVDKKEQKINFRSSQEYLDELHQNLPILNDNFVQLWHILPFCIFALTVFKLFWENFGLLNFENFELTIQNQ